MKLRARNVVWVVLVVLPAVWIVNAFRPTPVLIDLATARRAELVVTVQDDGKTRVRERYVIHAPVRGRLTRTLLDPGDAVRAGQTMVAEFEPLLPILLDERSRAEAEARLRRAQAAVQESQSRHAQAEAESTFAQAELVRITEMLGHGIVSPTASESAERDARIRAGALRAAEFGLRVAEFEVEVAAATLRDFTGASDNGSSGPTSTSRRIALPAPIDGVVLRVYEESARPLEAGAQALR